MSKLKTQNSNARVAIVADWITNPGGDDKVLWALHELFPKAPIFTTVYDADRMPHYKNCDVRTTYLQKIPFATGRHQLLVPLMTDALGKFDFSEFDLVISSSHTIGKNIRVPQNCRHICYCHTPLRYVWAGKIDDISKRIKLGPFKNLLLNYLKKQDLKFVDNVDLFIANSKTIQNRILKSYGRKSVVVYPPVETKNYLPADIEKGNYYLSIGRLIPYKRNDLIVRAFNKLKKKLFIAGAGPEANKLKEMSKDNIEFLGFVPGARTTELLQKAKAVLFAANEDFGLVPVEAMASGTPVIAYNKGGATETIVDKATGLFFNHQNPDSIVQAVRKYERIKISSKDCIARAKKFDKSIFNKKIIDIVRTTERT